MTSTSRVKKHRKELKDAGLVRKEVWIRPEHSELLKNIESKLRQKQPRTLNHIDGQESMHEEIQDCIEWDDFEHGVQLVVDEWLYVGANKVEVVQEDEYSVTYKELDEK